MILYSSLLLITSFAVAHTFVLAPNVQFLIPTKDTNANLHASSRNNPWESDSPSSGGSDEEEDDDDDSIDLGEEDWRSFRAKLVRNEDQPHLSFGAAPESDNGDLDGIGALFASENTVRSNQEPGTTLKRMTPLDPSQWAYDSGKVIEQGAIILGGVEQDYGFGLRQQYFHKAAILVLDHDESTFTKGIILNRPTDLLLQDDVNPGAHWRVWYGGDVQGLNSERPDIVCLHSLKSKRAAKASVSVMNEIQWTTFENAKKLVKGGAAEPSDFWVFCGYAGWGPGQLMGELDRKSWYMVATDSQTLLKELARQSSGADPRDAGLDTWDLLMQMIGRGDTAKEHSGTFDDLMLKEWAHQHLRSTTAGGRAGDKQRSTDGLAVVRGLVEREIDRMLTQAVNKGRVTAGTILRASSAERSPFLLNGQELHKSIVLTIADEDNITIGVILNRPSAKSFAMKITDKRTQREVTTSLPVRFGGPYAVKGSEPLLWLHCSQTLREAGVGSPVGDRRDGVWKCAARDVWTAVGENLARPDDFIVISGVSLWTKDELGDTTRGMQGKVGTGRFEIVSPQLTDELWTELKSQGVLTNANLVDSLQGATNVWLKAATYEASGLSLSTPPISGLGENFDEEDDSLVFKSDVKVSSLSDEALRSWVATFLLNAPSLSE